jgi:hypothetical protein
MGKLDIPEVVAKFPCLGLAVCSQRNIRATCVPTVERPLGFAVPNQVKA